MARDAKQCESALRDLFFFSYQAMVKYSQSRHSIKRNFLLANDRCEAVFEESSQGLRSGPPDVLKEYRNRVEPLPEKSSARLEAESYIEGMEALDPVLNTLCEARQALSTITSLEFPVPSASRSELRHHIASLSRGLTQIERSVETGSFAESPDLTEPLQFLSDELELQLAGENVVHLPRDADKEKFFDPVLAQLPEDNTDAVDAWKRIQEEHLKNETERLSDRAVFREIKQESHLPWAESRKSKALQRTIIRAKNAALAALPDG